MKISKEKYCKNKVCENFQKYSTTHKLHNFTTNKTILFNFFIIDIEVNTSTTGINNINLFLILKSFFNFSLFCSFLLNSFVVLFLKHA